MMASTSRDTATVLTAATLSRPLARTLPKASPVRCRSVRARRARPSPSPRWAVPRTGSAALAPDAQRPANASPARRAPPEPRHEGDRLGGGGRLPVHAARLVAHDAATFDGHHAPPQAVHHLLRVRG